MVGADIIKSMGAIPSAQDIDLPISPGDNVSQSFWERIVNLRIVKDRSYNFWKLRGGSEQIGSIPSGSIITLYHFVARGSGIKYLAIHNTEGKIFLKDLNSASSPTEVMNGFSTTEQVQLVYSNNNLYCFDYSQGAKKVYSLESAESSDFLSYTKSVISNYTLESGDSYDSDNIFDIEKNSVVIVIPTAYKGRSEFINDSVMSFSPFTAKALSTKDGKVSYRNRDRFRSEQVAGPGFNEDKILPYSPDLDPIVGGDGRLKVTEGKVTTNLDYRDTPIFRAYNVIDILSDGSVSVPGRPIMVRVNETDVTSVYTGINLAIGPAGTNVVKRFLVASRWQVSRDRAFTTTSSEYPNGAMFIIGELPPESHEYTDRTPDRKLLSPISELIPLSAGVPILFDSGQLDFNSMSGYKGSLIFGGYKINRPTPVPYTSASGQGNSYVSISSGINLSDSPVPEFVFEYTDGKRSDPVQATGSVLTDAVTTEPSSFGAAAEGQISVDSMTLRVNTTVEFRASIGEESVTFSVSGSNNDRDLLAQSILESLEGNAAIAGDYSLFRSGSIVVITSNTEGPGANGIEVSVLPTENYTYTGPLDPAYLEAASVAALREQTKFTTSNLSGGQLEEGEIVTPLNFVQVHSLNALVDKVYVIINRSTGRKLLQSFTRSDSEFNGKPIPLPATNGAINDLDTFNPTGLGSVQETVDLPDHVIIGIPGQELRIDRQERIVDGSTIERLLIADFDSDKTMLRYRLFLFTSSGIHVGYLTDTDTFLGQDFEMFQEAVTLKSKAMTGVGRLVVLQLDDGIYFMDKRTGQLNKIVDRHEYDIDQVSGVFFNKKYNEYWLTINSSKIVIFDVANNCIRTMMYASGLGNVATGIYADSKPIIAMGSSFYLTDDESIAHDQSAGNVIKGIATTRHILSQREQVKVLQVRIMGEGYSCKAYVDLQTARLKRNNEESWSKDFTTDMTLADTALKMSGTQWRVDRRAVMPRLQLEITHTGGDGFIEHALIKTVSTENEGIARY